VWKTFKEIFGQLAWAIRDPTIFSLLDIIFETNALKGLGNGVWGRR
jgi:hypothetical protein